LKRGLAGALPGRQVFSAQMSRAESPEAPPL
jgi:hypothetical protein